MIALRRERIVKVGHRGAPALAPENTLGSLAAAIEAGVDVVEFDVLDTADGQLVLAHSDSLLEVSHGAAHGRVRARTLSELRQVAPALPTFEEALSFLSSHQVGVQVDVKLEGAEGQILAGLRRHGLLERSFVSAFWPRTLRVFAELEPRLPRALSYPQDRVGLTRSPFGGAVRAGTAVLRAALPARIAQLLQAAGANAATLHHAVVSRPAIERCHSLGAAVYAWTVDDLATVERLVRAEIDGIITNDPRIFGLVT